jgi:hypothetical protein
MLALSYPRGFVMHNRIDMDPKHSRAIVQEVGERLRAVLKEEPECPGSLYIKRMRQLLRQRRIRFNVKRSCSNGFGRPSSALKVSLLAGSAPVKPKALRSLNP